MRKMRVKVAKRRMSTPTKRNVAMKTTEKSGNGND
jgi:hypothetical protein